MNSFFFALPLPSIEKTIYPTGLPTLDKWIGGGFRLGGLCLVRGNIASGKTAFCRTVLKENNENCCEMVQEREPGSHDLTEIQSNYSEFSNRFTPNYSYNIQGNVLNNFENSTRQLKRLAVEANSTYNWTIPTYWSNPSYGESYFMFKSADYVISLAKQDGKQNILRLIKNRYGPTGSIEIEFKNHNNEAIMTEKI